MAIKRLSILFVVSEVEGLIKSGGLADVAHALPKALDELDQDVRLTLPAYRQIPNIDCAPVLLTTQLDLWPHTEYKVRQLESAGVTAYAIDCEKYFDRSEMYAEDNQAYSDNGERFAFFSAACLDMLPKLGFQPDIVHANDWHTGLVPFLINHRYRKAGFFSQTKSIFSIHNAVFKGVFRYDELKVLPEMHPRSAPDAAVSATHISMLKAGVMSADKINAVSPTYAQELKTELGSHGMAQDFRQRQNDLVGILNGCDYTAWNPETDEYLPKNYSAERNSMVQGKQACKLALQEMLGFAKKTLPVYGMVCRLTSQKGLHYLLPILEAFLRHDVQLVIVGTGDPVIASKLIDIEALHGERFKFVNAYDNRMAHLVEAGSDFFLMPSEFEPCGLNQIYSMAYGTLPIVRGVGGLKDSVNDYDTNPAQATGFIFEQPTPESLLLVLQRSLLLYLQQPDEIKRVQLYAMRQDFCWKRSATEYLKIYHSAF
ncbi:glycogen synthase GlgA [Vibrio ostreicida]|uniref:Glycogen synthase n=1 Tax=Vibrio ostreicida TaxID=526588 RepID=A0ABT8BT16_9VIBR|nr:glycogen synthase GlgA [Vibrio ostreicida]MDN3609589.1 glycogen synthase GlgA [Vibrio ostreicida]NPD08461.1 glycogen synthase GlgA [Vibrio ostreicida]